MPNRAAWAPALPFLGAPSGGAPAAPAQGIGIPGGRRGVGASGELTGTVPGNLPPAALTRRAQRGGAATGEAPGEPGGAPTGEAPGQPGGLPPAALTRRAQRGGAPTGVAPSQPGATEAAPTLVPGQPAATEAAATPELTATVAAPAGPTALLTASPTESVRLFGGARTPAPAATATLAAAPAASGTRVAAAGGLTRTRGTPTLAPTVVPPTETPTPSPTFTPSPTSTPALSVGMTSTRTVDGMEMVAVPAGEFEMGTGEADLLAIAAACKAGGVDCKPSWFAIEQPTHTVTLSPFWLDRTEVTNAQFATFLNERGIRSADDRPFINLNIVDALIAGAPGKYHPKPGFETHPAVRVYFAGADAYCQWAGARLPTEAEWEYAARGSRHAIFPWGDAFDGTIVNYWSTSDGYTRTAPVGVYPESASWAGGLDLAGNVAEWVADWFGSYGPEPVRDPQGPMTGELRIARGGSAYTSPVDVRTSGRGAVNPADTTGGLGVRCAKPAG